MIAMIVISTDYNTALVYYYMCTSTVNINNQNDNF